MCPIFTENVPSAGRSGHPKAPERAISLPNKVLLKNVSQIPRDAFAENPRPHRSFTC